MKGSIFTILQILALMCLSSIATSARQENSSVKSSTTESENLWQLVFIVHDKLTRASRLNNNKTMLNQVLAHDCQLDHPANQLASALQTEAEQYRSNYGLSFRGGYTSGSLNSTTGDDPNAYLELSWDLWRQGFAENRRRANSLAQQASLNRLQAQLAQLKLDGQCRRYRVFQAFRGMLSHLLSLKLALMEPVYQIEKRAYFKRWSFLDDLLVSDQDLRLLKSELAYLNSSPAMDTALNNVTNLPVIDIDIQALIQNIRDDDRFTKIQQLEKQALSDKINVTDDDRLRLFVRKQFDVGNNSQAGVVAGLRFSIPLEKRTKRAEQYRLAHIDSKSRLQAWERITRTRASYQSLQEQLQRTIKQQYRLLRANERLRRSLVQKQLNDDVQLASTISRLRSSLDASIELVRAKEELYRRVNQVFLVASVKFNPQFVKVSNLNENSYRGRDGERSIYIWSKGFNLYNNDTILAFLQAKHITRVLLTAGRNVKREKLLRFIRRAEKLQIKVESIIGPNNLFFSSNHAAAAIKVEAAASLSDAVHLDIEPHTFADYKQNKASYLEQYINMLRTIRSNSPDITLTVAAPFHWPAATYAALGKLVDRVYIMDYGSTKVDTVIRRLQPALENISHDKVIPVLRVTDFEDEWQLEKMLQAIQDQTGLKKYSLHTYRRFVQKASQ